MAYIIVSKQIGWGYWTGRTWTSDPDLARRFDDRNAYGETETWRVVDEFEALVAAGIRRHAKREG
jgi:hypothetical protein